MNLKHVFERHLENFFGLLIALNILHQILASTTLINDYPDWVYYFELFYQVSMVIYVAEIGLRTYLDRRLGFLGWVDAIIVLNYFILGGVYDLRAFRLFRVFEIYKHTRILFPSNTLVRTIYLQRFALLGSQIMVLSVLLVFSILIYFIEGGVQPESFGSIPDAMWWGIATLTTVGYGDIYPATLTGKILASLTMFLGIGMFALPAAILASAYYEEIQKKNFLVSIETITEIPLFAKLPIAALSKINQKLDPVIMAAKKPVFKKGDKADSMYIIEFGHVQVEIDEPVTLGPGDYFGEMGLLGNTTRNATITTLDEVKLLELTKEDLEELFNDHEVLFREIEDKIATINS
ncbi:MAG: cyclic nucleotide-gated ion channel [Gammaproteobacteria bacterium]|jgi:voltage-gated potassium channel|tara:strand:- start:2262 stop:3308 length:1047 start_codon:yes stop_codon:yes gene_type:complete